MSTERSPARPGAAPRAPLPPLDVSDRSGVRQRDSRPAHVRTCQLVLLRGRTRQAAGLLRRCEGLGDERPRTGCHASGCGRAECAGHRRVSSRSVARGALLPVHYNDLSRIRQAVVRRRTLCQVFDHCPLSGRPTAAHLAAFILPSLGRLASATLLLGHWCDILRIAAMGVHASHCGLRTDDVGTNKRSIGELAVDGCAFETRDDGDCSAAGWSLERCSNSVADCCGFDGNNALDQPRARSSNAEPDAKGESFDGGSVSDPMSSNSMLASFGISTLGASPFATVVATASANLTSGRCQEPR